MLRIAIPNKGSLADESIAILKEAGYRQRTDSRDLVLLDNENGVEFYYLRPRDIALYVGSGELEAGITGRDLLILVLKQMKCLNSILVALPFVLQEVLILIGTYRRYRAKEWQPLTRV